MAKKKTVRKTTKKKTTARSASGAVPSPAVVAKKMKKLRKKPAKKATRRAGAGGDAGVGKAILNESGRLAKQALAEKDPQFTIPVRANSNTEWDEELGLCVPVTLAASCYFDTNFDGNVGAPDLLNFLSSFGQSCDNQGD